MDEESKALMQQRYNVNQRDSISNVNNVINVSSVSKKNPYGYTPEEVRGRVEKLMTALNDPDSFPFFCKAAWNMSESDLWATLEDALAKGRNPAAYFSKVCKIKMSR